MSSPSLPQESFFVSAPSLLLCLLHSFSVYSVFKMVMTLHVTSLVVFSFASSLIPAVLMFIGKVSRCILTLCGLLPTPVCY